MKEVNRRVSGTYKLRYCRGTYNLIPTGERSLFDNFYNPNSHIHSNVLIYIDESKMDIEKHPRDSSIYLAQALSRNSEFNVAMSTEPNPNLARYADIVIPRFDPPLKRDFIEGLKEHEDRYRLFVNPTNAQEYFGNKRYLQDLDSDLLPKTMISSNPKEIGYFMRQLQEQGKEAIYKPLQGFGGEGISQIPLKGKSLEELINIGYGFTNQGVEEGIFQEFIEGIDKSGDKRIHLVNGYPVGAVLRKPKEKGGLCNVKKGGLIERTEITSQDYKIISKIKRLLRQKNVVWAGIDILGGYLGEINAVSPGLLYRVDEFEDNLYGKDSAVNHLITGMIDSLDLKPLVA